MKRFATLLVCLMVLSLSTIVGAAAYQPYEEMEVEFDDVLVESPGRAGVTIPEIVWDLSLNACKGQFTYSANVYGNYLLKTSTGGIGVVVNSSIKQQGNYEDLNEQTLKLLKKTTFGSSGVSSKKISRTGQSTATFTGLEKNKGIYFIALTKAHDNAVLTGSFTATE